MSPARKCRNYDVLAPEKPSSCPLARLVVSISYTNEGGVVI